MHCCHRANLFVNSACLIVIAGAAFAFRSFAGDSTIVNQTPNPGVPRFDYHDDRDGRNLAEVDLKIDRANAAAGPSLNIHVSAVGPNVDPIPGYRGVRGANRYTAEELELMLTDRHEVVVQTWRPSASVAIEGSLRAGRRGRIPERRLMPDGRIDVLAVTRLTYPLDLTINTGDLAVGSQHTDVVVDGIPRMRISFDFDGREAHITGFESLGDPDHNDAEPLNQEQAQAAALNANAAVLDAKGDVKAADAKPKPPEELPPPVSDADWDARDLEGKWVLFDRSAKSDKYVPAAWVQYLVKRQDYEFLEMVGIYQLDLMKQQNVGWALANANAPQWLRAAAWSRRSPQSFGHGEAQARSILRTHNPGWAFSWLDKHKDVVASVECETKRDYDFLRLKKYERQDLGNALPPLKAADVFKYLDAPAELATFGDRTKAEPGKVYEHQVIRAIDGLVNSGYFEEPWISKVIALTKHKNANVRQAAYLSVSYFVGQMEVTKYPLKAFEKTIDDSDELPAIRESALTAYSYFSHPAVFVKLHAVGLDPTHPSWRIAISRLADFSSEFTLTYLSKLSDQKLSEQDLQIWNANAGRIRTNVASQKENRSIAPTQVLIAIELERAAWAEYTNDPITAGLTQWTIQRLAGLLDAKQVAKAEAVQKSYEPSWTTGDEKENIKQRVRELAGNVIEEWKGK